MVRKRKRGFAKIFFVLLLIAAIGGAWLTQRYLSFADGPMSGLQTGGSVIVESGDNLPVVVRKLRAAGISTGETLEWRVLARKLGAAGKLQVGEYALEPGTTPSELLRNMRDGKVIHHGITFIEGWNIRQLRAALAKATPLKQETAALSDTELMKLLGHPGQHPEGRFLPETYLHTSAESDLDVLKRAYAAMEKALAAAWEKRQPDTVLKTPEEMLALASIVEKETGNPDERPRIAGLFEKRLKIGMPLQTDPTVIYGIGASYDGNIRKRDLQTDTPYNSYTRTGLPPTPIAMPGAAALNAVAQPAPGEALFFVARGDGSGRHLFARTLTEHDANVRVYLQNYRKATRAPEEPATDTQ